MADDFDNPQFSRSFGEAVPFRAPHLCLEETTEQGTDGTCFLRGSHACLGKCYLERIVHFQGEEGTLHWTGQPHPSNVHFV